MVLRSLNVADALISTGTMSFSCCEEMSRRKIQLSLSVEAMIGDRVMRGLPMTCCDRDKQPVTVVAWVHRFNSL